MAWTARLVVAGLLGLPLGARNAAAGDQTDCQTTLPQHIRIMDCRVAQALAAGLDRSPSLRGLIGRISELKGIVYVSVLADTKRGSVAGGLSHRVSSAGESCILQVGLVRDYAYRDRVIATLAHEFTHALEVLEHPEARTEGEVNRLYERIGFASGADAMETDAALEMGRRVAAELKDKKNGRRT